MRDQRIVITAFGAPNVLVLTEVDIKEPALTGVRVRVETAGVAYLDQMERRTGASHPGAKVTLPYTPGNEVAGVIDAIGAQVGAELGLHVGQRVIALMEGGGYASYAYPDAWRCIPIPAGVDPVDAVALPINYWTAYHALHNMANIQAGQRVLIHGGGGGVGTAALQLSKLAGLTTYATGSTSKQDVIRSLGATPIDYKTEDFVQRIHELTGDGVDTVVDPIGGSNIQRSYRTLRTPGTLLMVGIVSTNASPLVGMLGTMAGLAPHLITNRRKRLKLVMMSPVRLRDAYRNALPKLLAMVADGKLKPVIGARLPLVEAPRAHELLEKAQVAGKIVLLP